MSDQSIYQLIKEAKRNNGTDSMIFLIEKFKPLIFKYKSLLLYEDAKEDLILYFIEMIKSIKLDQFVEENSEYKLLKYISICMHYKYIKLSGEINKYNIISLDAYNTYDVYLSDNNFIQEMDKIELIDIIKTLNIKEKKVVILKYYYELTDIEIANYLHL